MEESLQAERIKELETEVLPDFGAWTLRYRGLEWGRERLRESICALGNGYLLSRAAHATEKTDEHNYPATYIAGCYNRLITRVRGRPLEKEDLVKQPSWLPWNLYLQNGGGLFCEIREHELELDFGEGILRRWFLAEDAAGRLTRVYEHRLVHMGEPRLVMLLVELEAVNWSGRAEIVMGIDADVSNRGVEEYYPFDSRHLEIVGEKAVGSGGEVLVRTIQSQIQIACVYEAAGVDGGAAFEPARPDRAEVKRTVEMAAGQKVRAWKRAAYCTSRDPAVSHPLESARQSLRRWEDESATRQAHTDAWEALWQRAHIEVEGIRNLAPIVRLHVFHLLQTLSPHSLDLDTGVPGRGWHGEGYRGHVFWDELLVLPFYNLRYPEVSRAVLVYRYRRLGRARQAAAEQGLKGAMFPWQSGSDGSEETAEAHFNPLSRRLMEDHTQAERHINNAIAINLWRYWQETEDTAFMLRYGAELLFEMARFWASRVRWSRSKKRYVIERVIGPDEFHDRYPGKEKSGVDNNAYTNVTTAWALRRAAQFWDELPEPRRAELEKEFGLREEEVEQWRSISRRLYVPWLDGGLIEQFSGFQQLQELDWERYQRRYHGLHRLDLLLEAEGDSANRYRAIKQADVLMLFYLFDEDELKELGEQLGYPALAAPETVVANLRYYEPITTHGSSLSGVVHAAVKARWRLDGFWEDARETLLTDLDDRQHGAAREGIHLGAMGGTVHLMERGLTGLRVRDGGLWFSPWLPAEVNRVRFRIEFRDHWLDVRLEPKSLTVGSLQSKGAPICLRCGKDRRTLEAGREEQFSW